VLCRRTHSELRVSVDVSALKVSSRVSFERGSVKLDGITCEDVLEPFHGR
jgi:hypothetical protein